MLAGPLAMLSLALSLLLPSALAQSEWTSYSDTICGCVSPPPVHPPTVHPTADCLDGGSGATACASLGKEVTF